MGFKLPKSALSGIAAGFAAAVSIFSPAALRAAETAEASAPTTADTKSEEKSLFDALLSAYKEDQRKK